MNQNQENVRGHVVKPLFTEYVIPMLIEHLTSVKYSFECSPDNISLKHHNNSIISMLEIKETEAQRG